MAEDHCFAIKMLFAQMVGPEKLPALTKFAAAATRASGTSSR